MELLQPWMYTWRGSDQREIPFYAADDGRKIQEGHKGREDEKRREKTNHGL